MHFLSPYRCKPDDFKVVKHEHIRGFANSSELVKKYNFKNIKVGGFPVHAESFLKLKSEVFQEFTIRQDVKNEVQTFLEKVRLQFNTKMNFPEKQSVTYVGVHSRRTDYYGWIKTHCDGLRLSTKYFEVIFYGKKQY